MLIGPMPGLDFRTAVAPTDVSPSPKVTGSNPFKTPEDFGADNGLFGNLGSFFTGSNTEASNKADAYNKYLQWLMNSEENAKAREYDYWLSSTQYQRAFADLKAAGINPYYAFGKLSGSSPGAYPTAVSSTPDATNNSRMDGSLFITALVALATLLNRSKIAKMQDKTKWDLALLNARR